MYVVCTWLRTVVRAGPEGAGRGRRPRL